MELDQFVAMFALGMREADARRPTATSTRTGTAYQPGIGPHSEAETVRLALQATPGVGTGELRFRLEVPYPNSSRSRCDLVLGDPPQWAIELKMLRMMGDNGKPNDNMLMHILSPYPAHRSALTDCQKLVQAGFGLRAAIVIFGYDYPGWPMDPAVEAFEALARRSVHLTQRVEAVAHGLVHPVHTNARVCGWELVPGAVIADG